MEEMAHKLEEGTLYKIPLAAEFLFHEWIYLGGTDCSLETLLHLLNHLFRNEYIFSWHTL